MIFGILGCLAMVYRFGEYSLDTVKYELKHGDQKVSLEPQVFDVLRFLMENRERVVSKDDLIDAVWGGRIVSDATLSSRISAARSAVGDTGDAQSVIRTIPKRGFQFVIELEAENQTQNVPHSSTHRQKVKFCRSLDGTQLAYATTGSGYPLVRAGHWLTHLEYDWHSPV